MTRSASPFHRLESEADLEVGKLSVADLGTFRQFEVTRVAKFAVVWWIDGPAKQIYVVEVQKT